ncbi:hypothetical protein F5B17DRAFT_401922, partial [Nemania serpens]
SEANIASETSSDYLDPVYIQLLNDNGIPFYAAKSINFEKLGKEVNNPESASPEDLSAYALIRRFKANSGQIVPLLLPLLVANVTLSLNTLTECYYFNIYKSGFYVVFYIILSGSNLIFAEVYTTIKYYFDTEVNRI